MNEHEPDRVTDRGLSTRMRAYVASALAALMLVVGGLVAPAAIAAPACTALESGAAPQVSIAIQRACSQLGVPYLLGGGHGPTPGPTNGWLDCSGLVRYAYAGTGDGDLLGRGSTRDQWDLTANSQRIYNWADLIPGDLVYLSKNGAASGIDHVSLYLGQNWLIHAPQAGQTVRMYQTSNAGSSKFFGAVRLYNPVTTAPPAPPAPPAPVVNHDRISDWTGDGYADVLGVNAAGNLLYYAHDDSGLSAPAQIGNGWGTFKHVMAADWSGDGAADVLGVDAAGDLWYYPHQGEGFGTRTKIGFGWGSFKHVVAADWSGDGKADILAVDAAGDLWYYPHNADGLGNAVKIGFGWGSYKHVMAADWNRDGKADILGVDAAGELKYYEQKNNGLDTAVKMGFGWGSFKHVMASDWSGDGHADILGVDDSGTLWYYPHQGDGLGTREQLGIGWSSFLHVM